METIGTACAAKTGGTHTEPINVPRHAKDSSRGKIKHGEKGNEVASIRILGTNYRVATTELTRADMESAGALQLARWIDYAGFELELAQRRGAWEIAEEIIKQIKQMRAQQAINQAAFSREKSLMLGVI